MAELAEKINKKLEALKSELIKPPRLYVTEFFFDLRTQIDIKAEELLDVFEPIVEKAAGEISRKRLEMIAELDRNEKHFIDHWSSEATVFDAKKYIDRLEQLEMEIQNENLTSISPALGVSKVKADLKLLERLYKVHRQLGQIEVDFRNELFSERNFILRRSGSIAHELGRLIIIDLQLTRLEYQLIR